VLYAVRSLQLKMPSDFLGKRSQLCLMLRLPALPHRYRRRSLARFDRQARIRYSRCAGRYSGKVVSVYSTPYKACESGYSNNFGVCKVLSYATSAYSAASPQFVSAAGSTGQKNTLSIAGFVSASFQWRCNVRTTTQP